MTTLHNPNDGTGFVFRDCIFDRTDLADLDAKELAFEDCSLRRADVPNLACESLHIVNSNLEGASFDRAVVHEAEITNCVCALENFKNARFNLSRMVDSDMSL